MLGSLVVNFWNQFNLVRNCWGIAEWRASHQGYNPIFDVDGIEISSLHYDLMHTKYLGVDAYYIGALISYIVDRGDRAGAADRLEDLWGRIQEAYGRHQPSSRFNSLTFGMFRPGGAVFPHLRGKASEIRGLVPVMEDVCLYYLDTGVHLENLMLKGIQQSALIDKILRRTSGSPTVEGRHLASLRLAISNYNAIIAELGRLLHHRAIALFHYTVKNHVLEHIGVDAAHLHPQLSWAFASEDFMLSVRKMVQSSSSGSKPVHIQNVAMRKYMWSITQKLLPPGRSLMSHIGARTC